MRLGGIYKLTETCFPAPRVRDDFRKGCDGGWMATGSCSQGGGGGGVSAWDELNGKAAKAEENFNLLVDFIISVTGYWHLQLMC